jgi:myo-inositol-1-phosphate synthase
MTKSNLGIWLIGARGSVATSLIVGLIALRKGLISTTGLVSELPFFAHLSLAGWSDFVVGGHEVRQTSLVEAAEHLCETERLFAPPILAGCRRELAKVEKNIRTGTMYGVGAKIEQLADVAQVKSDASPRGAVERISADIQDFVKKNNLKRLVVVNLASTEPTVDERQLPKRWSEMEAGLDKSSSCSLPASSLYAIAAIQTGFPYVNFTPSLGATPRAIQELVEIRKTSHAGCDGKTGETLLKTVLAPMFAARNLNVLSWVGHNIFGNLDGKVLDDPGNKATKVSSKDAVLRQILNYQPQSLVSIEYVKSLGDWKTAWDHIHFAGFFGTPMKLQFTWQGADSVLAAPLVIDLVRFVDAAHVRGETGVLTHLASFFKSPLGVQEHSFDRQFQMLLDWAKRS